MTRRWILLLLAPAIVSGCAKRVELTFVNYTNRQLPVELKAPNQTQAYAGVVAPHGGLLKTKIDAPKDQLPAGVRWQAGRRHHGMFTVAAKTPKRLRIDLTADGPSRPYEWSGKIKFKRDHRDDDDD